MAEKRMFSKTIVDSDAFLEMPLSAQALYFHLGVIAENKGVVTNARSFAKSIGCQDNDIEILINNGFIKRVDSEIGLELGYFEIVHWYENNGIGETAKKRNNYKYRKWREQVISRDKCCQICGSTVNLVAHHIKSFAKYPLLRTELKNGIALCDKCHKILHKEEVWQ